MKKKMTSTSSSQRQAKKKTMDKGTISYDFIFFLFEEKLFSDFI